MSYLEKYSKHKKRNAKFKSKKSVNVCDSTSMNNYYEDFIVPKACTIFALKRPKVALLTSFSLLKYLYKNNF